MANLNVEQKSVQHIFEGINTQFLIPDYQRPYAWTEAQCLTLWDDIFAFAFPDNDSSAFKDGDEYFLGPIVTFKNEAGQIEIIDGQQRITTLMLLLRAFYECGDGMKDSKSISTRKIIERCIWKTNEFEEADKTKLKIVSEVATDNDKEEFTNILKTGSTTDTMKSIYAQNYRFFQKQIRDFIFHYPTYFSFLPIRILKNCILLPIEAESQDTALRIFSTLNDRGLPLSDSDIFKAQFYKIYKNKGQKDQFIEKWKDLEEECSEIFHPSSGTAMDELFTRYMYYERAKMGNKLSTTEALRRFYEKDKYKLFQEEGFFDNLIILADFWKDVSNQNVDRFSNRVLRKLFVLNYAPNGMWTYFVSVYFMHNKDSENMLDDDSFYTFLDKIIAFIWAYALTNPGVNALRTPVYAEMVNIVNDKPVEFNGSKFDPSTLRSVYTNFTFTNNRQITKSMLAWWAFQNANQPLLSLETVLEVEHIYPRNRQENEHSLKDKKNLDSLGNKALLEKKVNIRASDYRFEDKKKYYLGYVNARGQNKSGTKIQELLDIANSMDDFTEKDIISRNSKILDAFIYYLMQNNLTI